MTVLYEAKHSFGIREAGTMKGVCWSFHFMSHLVLNGICTVESSPCEFVGRILCLWNVPFDKGLPVLQVYTW